MFAPGSVQASVSQHQPLDRFATDDVRFDDLIDVSFGDVPIPDGFRIDHEIWAVFALIEAARLVGAHTALESTFRQFLLEQLLQPGLAGRITASSRIPRRPLVAAYENMFLELGHEDMWILAAAHPRRLIVVDSAILDIL